MEEAESLRDEFGIIAIKTDAAHFVDTIKDHMSEKFCFAKDEVFEKIDEIWNEFHDMHLDFVKSYHPKKQPHLIFATAYQDGVLHALERILDRSMTGEFSDLHNVQRRIAGYDLKIAEYRKTKNYWDIAYFSGYQNGLLQFAILNSDNVEVVPIPECFHPGQGELYLDEFNEIVRPTPTIHKAALREAKKRTASFAEDEDLVVQHLAWG